jgi:translation elongation factor P/translation initiation factor 5A
MALQEDVCVSYGVQLVFDGESYDYWSIKVKTLLISQDLLEFLEEGYEVKVKSVMETMEET